MCGRYQLDSSIEQLMFRFNSQNRYIGYGTKTEIFPTDMVPIVINEGHQNYIEAAKWGLVNYYDKRPLINARGETVDEKKTFKSLFANGRCIIPASSFFEWKKNTDGTKTKIQIIPKNIPIFGMAGLYKTEINIDGSSLLRCIIITIEASPAMTEIHDRMPVILSQEEESIWLDSSISNTIFLKKILKSYGGELNFKALC